MIHARRRSVSLLVQFNARIMCRERIRRGGVALLQRAFGDICGCASFGALAAEPLREPPSEKWTQGMLHCARGKNIMRITYHFDAVGVVGRQAIEEFVG